MAYSLIVASVALSFVSFPSAAQPLFDQASSASGLMHFAQMHIPNCKGVKRSGVMVPICCVRGSAAGCVATIVSASPMADLPILMAPKAVTCLRHSALRRRPAEGRVGCPHFNSS